MSLLRKLFGENRSVARPADQVVATAFRETTDKEISARTVTLSGFSSEWVNVDELDLFGTSRTSPNGRFAIITGSIMTGEPSSDRRRDGAYAVLESRLLRAHGRVERPHDGKVANNGAFVVNDWMHSEELAGRFLAFHPDGRQSISHIFGANLACNGNSAEGRYAACQTLSSPGSPDDTIVALFDVEKGDLLARFRPQCGTADGFDFDTQLGQVHVLTHDGDRETYGIDGQMIGRSEWLDRRIARGDLGVIGSILKDTEEHLDDALIEKLRAGLAQAATHGENWSKARANRLSGEMLETLGKPLAALEAYERALLFDPQVGVSRKADKICKLLSRDGAKPLPRLSRFEQQAKRLGIRHERILLETIGPKQWRFADGPHGLVEDAALAHFTADGWSGAAAEGGLILTLIKAASFAKLATRNADTFIEALYHQNVAFEEDRFEPQEMVGSVRRATRAQLATNWEVISATAGTTPAFYPKVTWSHVEGLFEALGNERLAEIVTIFATAPYDLRAGWPDLTLWRDGQIVFAEVKSPTDQMHASQSRLISTVLVPLGFDTVLVEVGARS
jgi:hypothetical protein